MPSFLVRKIDDCLRARLENGDGRLLARFDAPEGEPALAAPESVSWRVFRNPVALLIGGITAVILELAEPRVRSGVWDHTTFRSDPLARMRRTGLAAMVTVYAARGVSEPMIDGIRRLHAKIEGRTPCGIAYRADDPELLCWVHATALFGFMEAHHRFVRPLSSTERDGFIAEGVQAALLYGAGQPPSSEAELLALFGRMSAQLERSEIVFEFLDIMRRVRLAGPISVPLNHLLLRAAIDLVPPAIRETLGLGREHQLPAWGARALRGLGATADRLQLDSMPASRACIRMGLPADHLRPRRTSKRS